MFLLLPLTMSLFTSRQEQVDGDMCIIEGWTERERELHANALKSNEIMSLISAAGLQKTVTQVGRCYEDLVKEFLINVALEVGKPGHIDHYKVYERGRAMEFSPISINRYLNRSEEVVIEEQVPLGTIAKILTANQVKEWPASSTIPTSKLC